MSGKVWMSSFADNLQIFDKPGLQTKYFDADWTAARHELDPPGHARLAIMKKHAAGFALPREQFPEAAAVWNEGSFKRTTDLFAVGGFYAVKGQLAEVLSRFNFGDGGLISFPIYQADLKTPYPGEHFFLNLGARKNTLLPEQSRNVVKFAVEKDTGKQIWDAKRRSKDGDVAISHDALAGADLWFEEVLYNKLFFSDALAQAIIDIGMKEVFRLQECRVFTANG